MKAEREPGARGTGGADESPTRCGNPNRAAVPHLCCELSPDRLTLKRVEDGEKTEVLAEDTLHDTLNIRCRVTALDRRA